MGEAPIKLRWQNSPTLSPELLHHLLLSSKLVHGAIIQSNPRTAQRFYVKLTTKMCSPWVLPVNACMCSTNKLFPICEYVILLLDFQSSSRPMFPAPAPASVMRYVPAPVFTDYLYWKWLWWRLLLAAVLLIWYDSDQPQYCGCGRLRL